jgi:hypothetical protein
VNLMRCAVLSGMAILALAVPAAAQSKRTANTLKLDGGPGKATLADVAWLAGHRAGDGDSSAYEQVWVPPLAGSKEMMGMFRYVQDGKLVFTQHLLLVEDGGSLTLKFRHFDPAFGAVEEKDKPVVVKLVKVEKGAVYFDGLTFRNSADGGIDVFVAVGKEGGQTEEPFKFKPVKPAGR